MLKNISNLVGIELKNQRKLVFLISGTNNLTNKKISIY